MQCTNSRNAPCRSTQELLSNYHAAQHYVFIRPVSLSGPFRAQPDDRNRVFDRESGPAQRLAKTDKSGRTPGFTDPGRRKISLDLLELDHRESARVQSSISSGLARLET